MSDEERDYKRELHAAYSSERNGLNSTALTLSERFDKGVLYVGAGALAVSLTFLEKIAPNPHGWRVLILALSWASLVASILLHLLALSFGQKAIRRQMEILDADYSRYLYADSPETEVLKDSDDTQNLESKRTGKLTDWSLWTVIAGVALLCIFSVASLTERKESNHVREATATSPASP